MGRIRGGVASAAAGAIWMQYASGGAVGDNLYDNFRLFFLIGAYLNLVLAILNLIPIPPLDGSKILAEISGSYRRLIDHPNAGLISIVLIVLTWKVAGPAASDVSILAARGMASLLQGLLL